MATVTTTFSEKVAEARCVAALFPLMSGIGLLAATVALSSPLQAQTLEPGTYLTDSSQTDLLQGQDKTGPYPLAWNGIKTTLREKVEVVVDGRTLSFDEYTLDTVKGLITFRDTLKTASLARISYWYDPKASKRNGDFTTAPLALPQMNIGGASVKMTALSDTTTGGNGTRLVYGADKNMTLLNGGLTSSLLFTSGGTASKLGYKYGTDKSGFDAQFQRTEKDFASKVGKSVGYADALQKLTLGARLRPASWFGTTVSRNEQKDLNKSTGTDQTAYGLNLGGVGALPTLNLGRTANESSTAQGASTTVTTDKADFAAKVGSAALTAKTQKVATDDPDAAKDGTATAQEAGLNLALGKTSGVTAKNTRTTLDAPDKTKDTDVQDTTIALTTATTDKKAQATVSLTDGSTETATSVQARQGVSIKVQPVSILTLSAEQKGQKVTALANGVEGTAVETTSHSATAELAPMPGTKLSGGVQKSEQGDAKTSLTNLDATIGAGAAVEIGGGLTNRSASTPGGMTLDTTRARIAFRPAGGWTVTGAYTNNPEKDGVVSHAIRQEVGLKARLGGLDLGSGYAITTLTGIDKIQDNPQYGEISVSLGLRMDRFTKLDGSYRDGILYNGYGLTTAVAPRGVKSYTLGLSHVVGSAVSITMGGTMSSDYAQTGKPTNYKAEAKMGVKF